VPELPDLNHLRHAEKDALIRALWTQVQSLTARVAALEARLGEPSETADNSSLPPSKGQKPNKPENARRVGPRPGSLGRKGGGRPLACDPDETVTAKPVACAHCQAALTGIGIAPPSWTVEWLGRLWSHGKFLGGLQLVADG
jgi:transposase